MNGITSDMDFATRILIVDDDPGIAEAMSAFLVQHGFAADSAPNVEAMERRLAERDYQLIVLDVMMPGEDGLTALRRLAHGAGPPVIMLSAVGSDVDRIVGLEMGADDYLVKPCNPRELLARIRTVLRRHAKADTAMAGKREMGRRLGFAGWSLDPLARILSDPEGVTVHLSDGEFRLLLALVEHPRRVLSRDQLLDYSRGAASESYDRAIDVQMSRLRRKLASNGGEDLIRTVRGEGYMFVSAVTRP